MMGSTQASGTILCVLRITTPFWVRASFAAAAAVLLVGLTMLQIQPWYSPSSVYAQSTEYPVSDTLSPARSRTRTATVTATVDGTFFVTDPSLAAPTGPNPFLTEDAAIAEALATPVQSQTLPATQTPTMTRSPTITRTPTPSPHPSLTFTPSAAGTTAALTDMTADTRASAAGAAGPLDWRVFAAGLSIPLLAVLAGALLIRGRNAKQR